MSMDRAIYKMADLIAAKHAGQDMSIRPLFITHCQCPDRARMVRDVLMEKVGFKDSQILKAGGISTIYANSGGFVVAF